MIEARYDASPVDPSQFLMIVVGAHLRAEIADRPLAYRLQEKIIEWQHARSDQLETTIDPVVCTDLWYLNTPELHERPTICLGGPGVNALSGYFLRNSDESRQAELVDDEEKKVLIQIDPEFTELRTCLWGSDHDLTAKGVELFMQNYLDGFLRAVATQVEPKAD